jgi:hypothetical protein
MPGSRGSLAFALKRAGPPYAQAFGFSLRVSWVSLAGCGAGEEEVAFAAVAGKGGGALELGAGFGVAA